MRKIKGTIFDLDGTILDSMHVWTKIDIDFLGKRGIDVPTDYVKQINPMGFHAAAQYTKARFLLKESIDEIKQEWNDMALDAYANSVILKPGAKAYLNLIKKHGIKLSVATASSESIYKAALFNNEIYDLFDEFTTLAEVEKGKGFPDIYEKAAEKINLKPSECAVFEDLYEGLRAARSVGFITVGVYEPHGAYDEKMLREQSDIYIKDFSELLNNPELLPFDIV